MKLPRWLIAAAMTINLIFPLFMAGCWWTRWPGQTAIEFARALSDGETESIQRLMPEAEWLTSQPAFQDLYHINHEVTVLPRTVLELTSGRLRFRVAEFPGHFLSIRSHIAIPDRALFLRMLELHGIRVTVTNKLVIRKQYRRRLELDSAVAPTSDTELRLTLEVIDYEIGLLESTISQIDRELIRMCASE
jgi:hypothetical protein